jgi:5-amino-6-(5-phospho-D-ribitylamino)uracil phosphatase
MYHKLFVSDLDGTLMDNRPGLSEFTRTELTKLLENGFPFTFATARSLYSAKEIIGHLPLHLPVIELNGAFITDFHTGEHFDAQLLDSEIASSVIEIGKSLGLPPNVAAYDIDTHHMFIPPPVNPAYEFYLNGRREAKDKRLREVADPAAALDMEIVSCAFIAKLELVTKVKERIIKEFGDKCQCQIFEEWYFRPWYWLTVQNPNATKGHAIKKLSQMTSVSLQEVTVFGDQSNDVSMFEIADTAIAVGNAVPELLESADKVIEANTEDGVIKYLLQLRQ